MVMRAQDPGLVFFNCGKISGASQPHKHMQIFPEDNFSLVDGKPPLTSAIEAYLKENEV